MGRQKSAEAVVAGPTGEGLNVQCLKELGSSMTIRDADGGAETPRAPSEDSGRKLLEQFRREFLSTLIETSRHLRHFRRSAGPSHGPHGGAIAGSRQAQPA